MSIALQSTLTTFGWFEISEEGGRTCEGRLVAESERAAADSIFVVILVEFDKYYQKQFDKYYQKPI